MHAQCIQLNSFFLLVFILKLNVNLILVYEMKIYNFFLRTGEYNLHFSI